MVTGLLEFFMYLYFSYIFRESESFSAVIICCFPNKKKDLSLSLNLNVRALLGSRLIFHSVQNDQSLHGLYALHSAGHHSPWYIIFHTAHNSHLLDSSLRNQICFSYALSTK